MTCGTPKKKEKRRTERRQVSKLSASLDDPYHMSGRFTDRHDTLAMGREIERYTRLHRPPHRHTDTHTHTHTHTVMPSPNVTPSPNELNWSPPDAYQRPERL